MARRDGLVVSVSASAYSEVSSERVNLSRENNTRLGVVFMAAMEIGRRRVEKECRAQRNHANEAIDHARMKQKNLPTSQDCETNVEWLRGNRPLIAISRLGRHPVGAPKET